MAIADWLQELIGQNQVGSGALLRQAQAGVTSPVTGGAEAPDDAASAAAPAPNPAQTLIEAFQKYSKQSGNQQDPLMARGAQLQAQAPDAGLGVLSGKAFTNQQAGNARAGQVGQSFTLGGTEYHVYIDPKTGKRTVVRASGPALGNAAGVPSISAAGSSAQRTT